mmetsp:Transcript_22003/g.63090  ORF Transcript_22003/g.63090 Transcript_22003/m.63090 type:complete len:258 (+) Transcript_22003:44-817(+)
MHGNNLFIFVILGACNHLLHSVPQITPRLTPAVIAVEDKVRGNFATAPRVAGRIFHLQNVLNLIVGELHIIEKEFARLWINLALIGRLHCRRQSSLVQPRVADGPRPFLLHNVGVGMEQQGRIIAGIATPKKNVIGEHAHNRSASRHLAHCESSGMINNDSSCYVLPVGIQPHRVDEHGTFHQKVRTFVGRRNHDDSRTDDRSFALAQIAEGDGRGSSIVGFGTGDVRFPPFQTPTGGIQLAHKEWWRCWCLRSWYS